MCSGDVHTVDESGIVSARASCVDFVCAGNESRRFVCGRLGKFLGRRGYQVMKEMHQGALRGLPLCS